MLSSHYAPSALKFSTTLQSGQLIEYQGNPLEDMSFIHFIDRFVYKNPKKIESKRNVLERHSLTKKSANLPVNSDGFLNQPISSIAPEDVRL